MSAKHHHMPLSGGDRKALTKELSKSRAKKSTAWAGPRSQKQKDPDQQTCCKCPEA
jgi:hypothetical protein